MSDPKMYFGRVVAGVASLGIAVACTPHVSAPAVPTILPVGTSTPARAANDAPVGGDAECIVTDVRVGIDARIAPKGVDPFDVRLRKLPMRVRVETGRAKMEDREGQAATIFVSGPVELTAHTAISDDHGTGLFTARGVDFADGLVRVAEGHHLRDCRPHGGVLAGKVVFGDLEVEGVDVKCDALALGDGVTVEAAELDIDESATVLSAKAPTVQVCTDPTQPTCVTVPKTLPLVPGSARGAFIEVRAPFKDGSFVHGWAKRADLEATELPLAVGYGSSGGCGCGSSHGRSRRYPPDPREHFGEARLGVGAKIVATREGRGEWARVRSPLVVTIAMEREDAFAKITALSGISTTTGCDCDGLEDHAYIAREAVTPIR